MLTYITQNVLFIKPPMAFLVKYGEAYSDRLSCKGQIPLRYPARELVADLVSDLSQIGSSYVDMSR